MSQPTVEQCDFFRSLIEHAENTGLKAHLDHLANQKGKPAESLTEVDKQLLDKKQDFENNPRYIDLRELMVRRRIREGIIYYDVPEVFEIKNELYGFYDDYGIDDSSNLWNFDSEA